MEPAAQAAGFALSSCRSSICERLFAMDGAETRDAGMREARRVRSNRTLRLLTRLTCWAGAIGSVALIQPVALGNTQSAFQIAQVPVPPKRPAHLDRPEPAQPSEPAARATPAPAARSPTPASLRPPDAKPAQEEPPYHPMTEPGPMTHRRAAIRSCTEEWYRMKKSGAAGTQVWRDFSMECLQRKR